MLEKKNYSDQQVIHEIKQGNQQALVYMYKQNIGMVKNFVRKNNGKDEDVPDLMQDTVIAVWQNAHKSGFVLTVKLSTYIMSIAKNLWYKQLRKNERITRLEEGSHQQIADETKPSDAMDIRIIRQFVSNLDETCRNLLTYFYFDEFDNRIIAEKMGFANTDVVKSKKYQCFKKLEKEVRLRFNREDFFGS